MTLAAFKAMVREQFFMLMIDEKAALAAIPGLLPSDERERRKAFALLREVLSAGGDLGDDATARLQRIAGLFKIEGSLDEHPKERTSRVGKVGTAKSA